MKINYKIPLCTTCLIANEPTIPTVPKLQKTPESLLTRKRNPYLAKVLHEWGRSSSRLLCQCCSSVRQLTPFLLVPTFSCQSKKENNDDTSCNFSLSGAASFGSRVLRIQAAALRSSLVTILVGVTSKPIVLRIVYW